MLYTGIDYHKKYSVASTFDTAGARVKEARIDGNEPAACAAYFRSLLDVSAGQSDKVSPFAVRSGSDSGSRSLPE
jgi:hypothetical protein